MCHGYHLCLCTDIDSLMRVCESGPTTVELDMCTAGGVRHQNGVRIAGAIRDRGRWFD